MKNNDSVLIVTPFFSPNIGGVESHLDDLIAVLNKRSIGSIVSTYSPLTTAVAYKKYEKIGMAIIFRLPWLGYNIFPRIERNPFLTMLYLSPGLFFQTLYILMRYPRIRCIHAQGFTAAFIVRLCNVFFRKRTIMSTHALYSLPKNLKIAKVFAWILGSFDTILTLSELSKTELIGAGINADKISRYVYWVDVDRFKPLKKPESKTRYGWGNKTVYLFVGRLISQKGVGVFIAIAEKYRRSNTIFVVIGTGPEESFVRQQARMHSNLEFIQSVENGKIEQYYQASDYLLVPSLYPEGMARVVMEGIASGLYVIASNMGSLPEMIKNRDIGQLVEPSASVFAKAMDLVHPGTPAKRHAYAEKYFSAKNALAIIDTYHI
jgi:glycosyltransferase involved in cell wall biosynthesis